MWELWGCARDLAQERSYGRPCAWMNVSSHSDFRTGHDAKKARLYVAKGASARVLYARRIWGKRVVQIPLMVLFVTLTPIFLCARYQNIYLLDVWVTVLGIGYFSLFFLS